jgi:biotin-dependent carboxylase-like uncharacterized protein
VNSDGTGRQLDVLETGPLATVQDLGRPGYASVGVSPSGAADRGALALANRLVGNAATAAGLELTLGGLSVRAATDLIVAVTGAQAPVDVGGRPVGMNATVRVVAGAVLRLGRPTVGLRTYLAVRGGLDVPAVLGSRSADLLSGIGPPPLRPGDRLAIGRTLTPLPAIDVAPVPARAESSIVVHWTPGPRADRLTAAGLDALSRTTWTVGADSNRIGVRLDGPPLERHEQAELASEGLIRGAVQVPASGRPVIFLADHPTTGGYPVVAVVDDADTDALAQVRPGDLVELRPSRGQGPRHQGQPEHHRRGR